MSGFVVKYALVAIFGTAVIWFGIPELKTGFFPLKAPAAGAGRSGEPDAPVSAFDLPSSRPVPAVRPAPVRPVPPASPSSPPAASPSAPPVPAPRQSQGTGYDWGILAESANSYTSAGKLLGRIQGGTVIEKVSEHESSQGRLFRCRVLRDQQWRDGFFIQGSSIVMFQGPFAEAPPSERDKLVRYFAVKARLEDRRAELKERAIRANPHFESYQAAAKAMTEHQTTGKSLVEQREAATGMERSRIDDQLRKLKAKEAGIFQEFRRVEGPYKRWRASNDDGSIAIASDEQIQRLERQLAELEPDVRDRIRSL